MDRSVDRGRQMNNEVYFALCAGRIKIGTTANLKTRIATLATSAPFAIKLLGTIPGGREIEFGIHERLCSYRTVGEWFVDCEEVRAVIREICGWDVFAESEAPEP